MCVKHGGGSPRSQAAAKKRVAEAAAQRALATYGIEVTNADPLEQLLTVLCRTAGHVAFLADLVAGLEHDPAGKSELRQWHASGEGGHWEPSVWIRLYGEERDRLARVAKMCLDAGVAERQVRLAEQQGQLVADVLRRVLEGVGVDPASELARQVVRRELTAIAGGQAA